MATTKKSAHGHNTRYVRLRKNYCFACGKDNPEGTRLRFTYDEDRNCFVCRFRLGKRFTGPLGHSHGGIIATILDEAMGKVNKLRHVIAVTSEIDRRLPQARPAQQTSPRGEQGKESRGPQAHQRRRDPQPKRRSPRPRGRGLFIAVDPHKMFGKFVER